MTVLETKELKKYYGSGDTQVKALDGVDLTVENGEFVAIVGTSGSGKSTLLHMLGGLDRPTGGSVLVEGRDIFALKDEELTIFRRRKIGFVFQSYNLVPVLSVYDNIVLPIQLDGRQPDDAFGIRAGSVAYMTAQRHGQTVPLAAVNFAGLAVDATAFIKDNAQSRHLSCPLRWCRRG